MIPIMEPKEKMLIHELNFIGNALGYGHAMALLSALWRKECVDEGLPPQCAFIETIIDFVKPEQRGHIRASAKLYDEIIAEAFAGCEPADNSFPCDPNKAKSCPKANCYLNGGPCRRTTIKEYSK